MKIDTAEQLQQAASECDPLSYDTVIVAFSGGKDCLAAFLHLLDIGVPTDRIELWHHDVDAGEIMMDWPVTPGYCRAVADHFRVPIYFSWRIGGFAREMGRKDAPTAPVRFETPEGEIRTAGGRGPNGTRGRFPQVSADLSVRWCSAYLKIDVMAAAIRGQARFNHRRTLIVTGERAEESTARSRYKTFEVYQRADARKSAKLKRHVDQWRPVHRWTESMVWDRIRQSGIVPHPAYRLGWGRLSCMTCIFGSANQWATIKEVFPQRFQLILDRERESGQTIHRNRSVAQQAARGIPYTTAIENSSLAWRSSLLSLHEPVWVPPSQWAIPAGAFGEKSGPT